jgi:hypothetical protein
VTAGCCDPIEEDAIMRVEESIFIDRPPEAVFGFLSVRSNDPVWMASVTESEWLDPAEPMGVGRREFLDEVTEYERADGSRTAQWQGRWRSTQPASPSQQREAAVRPSCTSLSAFPVGWWER